jgi:sulfatase modifying factor 1
MLRNYIKKSSLDSRMVDYFLQNELSICCGSITYLKFDSFNCKIYQMHSSLFSTRENCNLGLLLLALGLIFSVCAFAQPKIEMVFVEGGIFQMGSETGDKDEVPIHTIALSSFNMAKYEVTQSQWRAIMNSDPSFFKLCDECPVEMVSWNDAQEFIQKLNAQSGKTYRLPTEAEWEYAAKGGKNSKRYAYSGSNEIDSIAWYTNNSSNVPHIVGTKKPNELGIYDMSGNVGEWCQDFWSKYSSSDEINPLVDEGNRDHIIRGCNFYWRADRCSNSNRDTALPDFKSEAIGFRIVLPVDPEN